MIITNKIAKWIVGLACKITPNTKGVTIWPFIFFWPPDYTNYLLKHEQVHLRQWKRYWIVGFPFIYIYYHIKYGYEKNPLEIEAG